MRISELEKLAQDDMLEFLSSATKMPIHYLEEWFGKCDEFGLDTKQGIRALVYARGIAGNDLDSWIYGDDMAMYVDLVANG